MVPIVFYSENFLVRCWRVSLLSACVFKWMRSLPPIIVMKKNFGLRVKLQAASGERKWVRQTREKIVHGGVFRRKKGRKKKGEERRHPKSTTKKVEISGEKKNSRTMNGAMVEAKKKNAIKSVFVVCVRPRTKCICNQGINRRKENRYNKTRIPFNSPLLLL